jgi:hypothetical protein
MEPLDVDRLARLGFFRHVAANEQSVSMARTREQNYAFTDEVHRFYGVDAENLAEHGVLDFLGRVAPFLRREGVRIDVHYRAVKYPATKNRPAGFAAASLNADGWFDEEGPSPTVESLRISLRAGDEPCEVKEDDLEDSDTYLLFLGDREHVVYRFGVGEEWDGWSEATRSTLALLSELLESHGSPERAYAYSGGNDLCIAFVTPEMASLINASSAERDRLHDGMS